jgi:hypothetical protein
MPCRCLFDSRLWVAALICAAGTFTLADEPTSTPTESAPEPFVRITQGGLMRYTDQAWGVVQATAYNHGTEPVDVNGVAWFATDPGLQFSRRFLLPPGSSRTVWMPILAPKLPDGAQMLDLHWATIRKDGTLASNRRGERLSDSPIRIPKTRLLIANISGQEKKHDEARELLNNIRSEIGNDVLLLDMTSPPYPPTREAWDIAGIVVLASDDLANDAAALNALRLWVRGGGRLWLQLDQIQPETVSALLGDTLPFEEVDRTSTTDVEMVPGEDSRDFRTQRLGFERPVAFTRVVVEPPAAVHQRLNGWPAAFSFAFGSGKVFCTAADVSAWFPPRHWRRHEEIANAQKNSWLDNTDAGRIVLQELAVLKEPTVAEEALTEYVVSQVGYTTPKRSSVAGLLVGFAVALAGVSLGLRFRQKSGWMLWAIPVLAVAASVTLVAVGRAARGEPHGRVLGQVIEPEPGQTVASVTETLTYYADENLQIEESVTSGGPLIPDRSGVASSRWRVEWTSVDDWALKGVELPPGVRVATNRTHVEFEEPLRATATFDSNGVTGQVQLPDGFPVEDALIGGSARVTVPVSHNANHTFAAGESILPPGEYLSSSLLDNEQSRRQSVFRDVFRVDGRNRPALQSPHLLFWSHPILPGSGKAAVRDEVGSSLFLIPLELQRPATAGEILIPGPFLKYRSVAMTKSGGVPAYFNNRTGEWAEYQKGSRVLLRFQVPPTVLPVAPTSATLTIKLTAGSRPVTIQHGLPDNLTESSKLDSPVGTFDVPLEFGDRTVLDENGGLHVLLEVGDVISEGESSDESSGLAEVKDEYWKVDWISLALKARVDAAESTVNPQVTSDLNQ